MSQLVLVFEIYREGMFVWQFLVDTDFLKLFFQGIVILGTGRNHLSKNCLSPSSALGGGNFLGYQILHFPFVSHPVLVRDDQMV